MGAPTRAFSTIATAVDTFTSKSRVGGPLGQQTVCTPAIVLHCPGPSTHPLADQDLHDERYCRADAYEEQDQNHDRCCYSGLEARLVQKATAVQAIGCA
eukprot:XP_001705345.1 Hypothetical protein GL50803_93669 [Giardia lamblia ATCC 50803]